MTHPILVGERIYLRLITPDDFGRSMEFLNDQQVTQYMQKPYPQTIESMESYYKAMQKPNLYLAICLIDTDIHVGNISLRDNSADKYYSEISIVIGDKEQWGKGYGTEAIKLLIDHCFRKRDIHKLRAGAVFQNKGCIKAFLNAGFNLESHEFEAVYSDGAWRDIAIMSMFKKDWEGR